MIGFQNQISACELFANVCLPGLLSGHAVIGPGTQFLLWCWAQGGFFYKLNTDGNQRVNNTLPGDRA